MELEITEKIQLDNGAYEGIIKSVEYRTKPYDYTDVNIEIPTTGDSITLTASYATRVNAGTALGRLLVRFGAILKSGGKIDPGMVLVGKSALFTVENRTTPKGTFANVMPETVVPSPVATAQGTVAPVAPFVPPKTIGQQMAPTQQHIYPTVPQ